MSLLLRGGGEGVSLLLRGRRLAGRPRTFTRWQAR